MDVTFFTVNAQRYRQRPRVLYYCHLELKSYLFTSLRQPLVARHSRAHRRSYVPVPCCVGPLPAPRLLKCPSAPKPCCSPCSPLPCYPGK